MKLFRNIAFALCLGFTGVAVGSTASAQSYDGPTYVYVHDLNGGRWVYVSDEDDTRLSSYVPVRFVNNRDQVVTLYMDGRYLGSVDAYSRERIWVPAGYHNISYTVGYRAPYHRVTLAAYRGLPNRVVIESFGWTSWMP